MKKAKYENTITGEKHILTHIEITANLLLHSVDKNILVSTVIKKNWPLVRIANMFRF